ncbi:MAG: hypothetical protein V1855_02725 [bacterium]
MIISKRLLISIILFFVIFCLLGIPFTHWWFYGADDFHALFLGYKTKGWKDLLYFFYEGHTNQGAGPSNFSQPIERTSFLSTYYRPFCLIFYAIEYWIYGLRGYFYHITAVFFHAANTVILFNIFLFFTASLPALLASLFFAFHPQIAYRFGAIVNLQYYVNVFLCLLLFLLFKRFLDTRKKLFYVLSCLLFMVSLFTRETIIILPGLLVFGTYLYEHKKERYSFLHFFQNIWKSCKTTLGFWIVAVLFLALRLFLYPLMLTKGTQTFSLHNFLQAKMAEGKVFFYDFLTLSWMPWGRPVVRGIVVLVLICLLVYFFVKNTHKIYVLFFLLCAAGMLWPAFVGPYSPRYFYEAYPFILCAFVILFSFSRIESAWIKKIGLCVLSITVVGYAIFCYASFARREKKMYTMSQAAYEFVSRPDVQGKSLCIIGWPLESFGDQCAPLFWILFDNPDLPVYCDSTTAIMQADSNVVTPTRWGNVISNLFDRNYVDIRLIPGGARLISQNSRKVFFTVNNSGYTLGEKIVHKQKFC